MWTLSPDQRTQSGRQDYMAEREGFEPSMSFNTHTPLAGARLQPLGHLSRNARNHITPEVK